MSLLGEDGNFQRCLKKVDGLVHVLGGHVLSQILPCFPHFLNSEVNVSIPQFFHHDGLTYHGPEHSKLNASGLKSSFCTYCSDEELTATVALRIPGPPIVTPLHHKESW